MPRTANPVPTYRKHKASGRAIITVRQPDGSRRDILLPGRYGSDESRQEYERLIALMRANAPMPIQCERSPADITINELVADFIEKHVATYYRDPDGKPTSEQSSFTSAVRPLTRLYGSTLAREFGPLALKSVRESMVTASWMTEAEIEKYRKGNRKLGWSRKTINDHVARIKLLYRWATENEMVPVMVYQALLAVAGLRHGRSGARENMPVMPVDPSVVAEVVPLLPPVESDIVQLLLLSGARVGELCQLTTTDIDRSGHVWTYTPRRHKTLHHGHRRVIAFGPRAQLILRRYLKADPDAPLFSPKEQDRLIKEQMRAARKSKVQPSQQDRSKKNPGRKPGERFTHNVINHALRRACERAGVPRFHCHQLRHTAALNVLREFGPEAARSTLGHKTINMTLHYSGTDVERAKEVAAKIG